MSNIRESKRGKTMRTVKINGEVSNAIVEDKDSKTEFEKYLNIT